MVFVYLVAGIGLEPMTSGGSPGECKDAIHVRRIGRVNGMSTNSNSILGLLRLLQPIGDDEPLRRGK